MSEATAPRAAASADRPATTAGGLLRQAREQQGLQVVTLASAIKVVPKKIEALEADRYDELTDASFARALAQAMARFLKIDPAPVLGLLPPLSGPRRLEQVAEGLNTPFRERSEHLALRDWARLTTPALWVALLIVLATLGLYLFPTHWRPLVDGMTPKAAAEAGAAPPAPVGLASAPLAAVIADAAVPPAMSETPAPVPEAATPAVALAASTPAGLLQFKASAPSWIEVVDAQRRTLISRSLQANEEVSLDGTAPFKVKIGNAQVTRMTVRGEPFDLAKAARDNIVRMEVK